MKRTGPTNPKTQELITELQKLGSERDAPIWGVVAFELSRSTRARREINLSRLSRVTNKDEVVLVPGKVLGTGELSHKLTIAALSASQNALAKIKQSGGKYVRIYELMHTNPEGSGIKIIG